MDLKKIVSISLIIIIFLAAIFLCFQIPMLLKDKSSVSPGGDYPAAIMVEGIIYYYAYETLAEVEESAIIGYTSSYTSQMPQKDGEVNFNRELNMPYAKVEDGIAVFDEGEWQLCRAKTAQEDANAEDKNTDKTNTTYDIDLSKISPMIQENVSKEVVAAAKTVIENFLHYENSASIEIAGNSQRFLNDMSYVIHCTCPIFGAFTDFNEMSAYDASTGKVSWEFFLEKEEFDRKLETFYDVIEKYLSNVTVTDSESMRAMLLYYAVIDDLNYDYELIGDNFNTLSKEEANFKSSPYCVLVEKSGICTNIAQAYMFLCTQAEIPCGTVLHTGGSGMHMWNVVQIDGKFYYCDPTWDANTSLKYFGMTVADRESWAGEYSSKEGTMLSATIPEKYEISDSRFETLRGKLPVEISGLKVDKEKQTITFVGYDYECAFECRGLEK